MPMSSSNARLAPAPATAHTPENELIARAAEGDAAAFEQIMRRHNRLLFRSARSILKDDGDAEEAVQDAYLRAWRGLGGFRSDSRLSTWLVRIVSNEALVRLRRTSAPVIPLEAAMLSTEPEIRAALTDAPERSPEPLCSRAQLRSLLESRIDRLLEMYPRARTRPLRGPGARGLKPGAAARRLPHDRQGEHRCHRPIPRMQAPI
ncbi:MAG TPA: sigma-70 family RNA polymerase sigma factor [Rubrivivax sp.]|nr:sigma-70 family RNA polymerase sigma factor [Rubrivivax sp.]